MADDIKADELVDTLRQRYADVIRTQEPATPAHRALQMADALVAAQLEELAGARVTYRAKPQIDGEAIAESWRRGLPVEEIIAKHHCSRSAAYKHHPSKAQRKRA